ARRTARRPNRSRADIPPVPEIPLSTSLGQPSFHSIIDAEAVFGLWISPDRAKQPRSAPRDPIATVHEWMMFRALEFERPPRPAFRQDEWKLIGALPVFVFPH